MAMSASSITDGIPFNTKYRNGTLFIPIVYIFGYRLSLACSTSFPLDLRILDDTVNSSIYISRCLTLARKNKFFVIYRKIKEELSNFIEKQNGCHKILAGSHSDCSDISTSDIDMLIVSDTLTVEMLNTKKEDFSCNNIVIADMSETQPGFTKLYFSSTKRYLPISYFQDEQQEYKEYFHHLKFEQIGPSFNIIGKNEVSVDHVYAIKCSRWPPGVREEWLNRQRPFNWPPLFIVEELAKSNCFVVPTGSDDSQVFEWRFAFPYVERGLVWSFNNTQLQCFILLKMIIKTFVKKIDKDEINSFHLKMVLFWECQNSNQEHWSEDKLFDCVRRCLRRLIGAIYKKELKHFIMEGRNVLNTKLKNLETREKIIETIQNIEKDISKTIVKCIRDIDNWFFLTEMINVQFILYKAETISDFNRLISSRVFWVDKTCLIREATDIISCFSSSVLEEIVCFQKTLGRKTDNLIDELVTDKKQKTNNCNLNLNLSRFMKDIHVIKNTNVCHAKIEQILSEVARLCQAYIFVHIGTILFEESKKTEGDKKKKLLLRAERHFKNSVCTNVFTHHLFLATFYVACGKYKDAQNIMTNVFRNERIMVCFSLRNLRGGISLNNGNGKLIFDILHDFDEQSQYAYDIFFRIKDIELVPNVLKYELCMCNSNLEFLCMHPLLCAKFLHFFLNMRTKTGLEIKYLQELKRIIIQLSDTSGVTFKKYMQELNILAYCYKNIGRINECIYFYMCSLQCRSPLMNSAVFQLAFLGKKYFTNSQKPSAFRSLDGTNFIALKTFEDLNTEASQSLDSTNSMPCNTYQDFKPPEMESSDGLNTLKWTTCQDLTLKSPAKKRKRSTCQDLKPPAEGLLGGMNLMIWITKQDKIYIGIFVLFLCIMLAWCIVDY